MRLSYVGLFCASLMACGGHANVQCEQDSNCDLSGGGKCVAGTMGSTDMWCAYPDPECPGGYRYSTQDIGGGLSGVCVPDNSGDGGTDGTTDGTLIDGPPVVPGSWAKQIPGAGFESVDALAVASDGSVFIAGSFDGTLDLGGGPLTATGTQDTFLAKFTSAGQHIWSVRFGGNSVAGITEIALLSNGDIAVAGNYRGSVTFGGTTLTAVGNRDVFVARLSSTGTPIWAATGGTTGDERLHDMTVDASDNIAVCGGINIGGGVPPAGTFFGISITGSTDAWLVRMTGAGTGTWGKDMAAGGLDDNCGVAMMANGDVAFVGNYNGTVDAGGSTFTSVSNSLDMYVARLKGSDGSHVFSISEGGAGNDEALDIDASGTSIILTGRFTGSMSFGGSTLTSAGGDDIFVAKLDASTGSHQFSARMGGTSSEVGLHISTRSDGQISVAGTFTGTADFGGTQITSNGDIDPFVADLDGANGAVNQVKSVGGPSRDEAHDVASTIDSLVFAGSFSNSITILNQTFTSMGMLDGYAVRYKR